MTKPKIVAIVGPTASGKTSLSIALAKRFNGEIISADSRQIYRGLDIGTGKVTTEEMDGVPHHLLDVAEPTQKYTAVDFKHDASAAIVRIRNRGHLPIIAGGTFFYLDQLRGKAPSAPVSPDEGFRYSLRDYSNATLHEKIFAADPNRAANIDPHNRRRLIRALEIIHALGTVPAIRSEDSVYEWLVIGVEVPREVLRENFAKRLESWLKMGFKDEVERLLKERLSHERFQELGFEYTLMLAFIKNEISEDELKEKFVQKNWQYAKRQLTWLKRDEDVEWFEPTNTQGIIDRVENFLHSSNS